MKSVAYAFLAALFVLFLQPRAYAQESYVPYIPEEELPDAVKILPAPPEDPSMDFDHDILRYMWGKQQRKDQAKGQAGKQFFHSLFLLQHKKDICRISLTDVLFCRVL